MDVTKSKCLVRTRIGLGCVSPQRPVCRGDHYATTTKKQATYTYKLGVFGIVSPRRARSYTLEHTTH